MSRLPFYPDDKAVAFMQGELVSAARAVLREHRQEPNDVNEPRERAIYEMRRLIGNAFQFRNHTDDPIQTALLILFMHGEQSSLNKDD